MKSWYQMNHLIWERAVAKQLEAEFETWGHQLHTAMSLWLSPNPQPNIACFKLSRYSFFFLDYTKNVQRVFTSFTSIESTGKLNQ